MRARRVLGAAIGFMVSAGVLASCDVPTRFFVVDSTADSVDASPGDGSCSTAEETCTLRAAVGEANALAEVTDITLADGATYVVTRAGVEDVNLSGDLDVHTSIIIHGNGSTVDGARLDRVFETHGATTRLTVEDLTITGGRTAGDGGGVKGVITAIRSSIDGNEAGGATACASPEGAPWQCTNFGTGGGGVYGDLLAIDSTISNNTATYPRRYGCGFYNVSSFPPIPLIAEICAISGGGGVVGTASLHNSTMSGNRAMSGMGHAVFGTVKLVRSTVSETTTTGTSLAGSAALAGSLVIGPNLTCAGLTSVLLDSSSVFPLETPIDNGTFTSYGDNVSNQVGCGLTAPADQPAAATAVGPLADNGGPTRTHLPMVGDAAVDAISLGAPLLCDTSSTTDQRGEPRPSGGACDAGAVERQPSDP